VRRSERLAARWRSVSITCAALIAAAVVLSSQVPGSTAPDFTLKTLAGDTMSLATFRGRPVFLNFWATWCAPCRAEMGEIVNAYRDHKKEGLQVLAIDLRDQERKMSDVSTFVNELQLPFPVLLDQKGKVRKSYALRGVPTSVFIDARGVVRFVNPGPITGEAIRRGLAEIVPSQ